MPTSAATILIAACMCFVLSADVTAESLPKSTKRASKKSPKRPGNKNMPNPHPEVKISAMVQSAEAHDVETHQAVVHVNSTERASDLCSNGWIYGYPAVDEFYADQDMTLEACRAFTMEIGAVAYSMSADLIEEGSSVGTSKEFDYCYFYFDDNYTESDPALYYSTTFYATCRLNASSSQEEFSVFECENDCVCEGSLGYFPHVDGVCGECTVLADLEHAGVHTCNQYCSSFNYECTRAWEEVNDNCEVLFGNISCDFNFTSNGTNDALCECVGTGVQDPNFSDDVAELCQAGFKYGYPTSYEDFMRRTTVHHCRNYALKTNALGYSMSTDMFSDTSIAEHSVGTCYLYYSDWTDIVRGTEYAYCDLRGSSETAIVNIGPEDPDVTCPVMNHRFWTYQTISYCGECTMVANIMYNGELFDDLDDNGRGSCDHHCKLQGLQCSRAWEFDPEARIGRDSGCIINESLAVDCSHIHTSRMYGICECAGGPTEQDPDLFRHPALSDCEGNDCYQCNQDAWSRGLRSCGDESSCSARHTSQDTCEQNCDAVGKLCTRAWLATSNEDECSIVKEVGCSDQVSIRGELICECSGYEPPASVCNRTVLIFKEDRRTGSLENYLEDIAPAADGYYYLKLRWPEHVPSNWTADVHPRPADVHARPYVYWKQSSNPLNTSAAEGFQILGSDFGNMTGISTNIKDTFSGLCKSTAAGVYLDGSCEMPWWYFAVGVSRDWQGANGETGFPAYSRTPTQVIELYACVPDLEN